MSSEASVRLCLLKRVIWLWQNRHNVTRLSGSLFGWSVCSPWSSLWCTRLLSLPHIWQRKLSRSRMRQCTPPHLYRLISWRHSAQRHWFGLGGRFPHRWHRPRWANLVRRLFSRSVCSLAQSEQRQRFGLAGLFKQEAQRPCSRQRFLILAALSLAFFSQLGHFNTPFLGGTFPHIVHKPAAFRFSYLFLPHSFFHSLILSMIDAPSSCGNTTGDYIGKGQKCQEK